MTLCICSHPLDDHSYERNKEADPEFEPPDCMVNGCGCTGFEAFGYYGPEMRARKVAKFAERSGRHRRMAETLLGMDDPVYAIADLLVDHESRLDALAAAQRALEVQLSYVKART